jgi:1-acyl-sn-glycerol-3-phosphate acyltransferase
MLSHQATALFAYAVLAALAGGALAWGLLAWRRTSYSLSQCPLYLYSTIMTRVVWRTRVEGRLLIPPGQGAVIVGNHISGIDPAVIALSTTRPVRWMVAKEYCNSVSLGWFFGTLGCIPVNRGGVDTAATKMAIRLAQAGSLVGMFPEGRINDTGRLLLPGRPGAALVALKARVPVVPCFVQGSPYGEMIYSSVLMTANIRLKIGRPIDLSPYYGREGEDGVLEELTKRFLGEIATLAGHPDYVPQLAGRRWKTGAAEAEPVGA